MGQDQLPNAIEPSPKGGSCPWPVFIIVEDHLKDFRIAEETARGVGFSEIELRPDINTARRYLETAAESG